MSPEIEAVEDEWLGEINRLHTWLEAGLALGVDYIAACDAWIRHRQPYQGLSPAQRKWLEGEIGERMELLACEVRSNEITERENAA